MAIKFYFKPVGQNVAALLIGLFFGINNKQDVLSFAKEYLGKNKTLPVNPEQISYTTDMDINVAKVVKLGEVAIPTGSKLATIEIESFFPALGTTLLKLTGQRVPGYMVPSLDSILGGLTSAQYVNYFRSLQRTQLPIRLVVSECGIDSDVFVESFTTTHITADDDIHYKLKLIECKQPKPKEMSPNVVKLLLSAKKSVSVAKPPARTKTSFAIGDKVIANGKYWYDSFGASPSGSFTNFQGKISHIASNKNATYKYHITTLDGGWRGWVKFEQIQGVA